jgi:hypothetical protein
MMTLKRRDGISLAKVTPARSPVPSPKPQKAATPPPEKPSAAGNSAPAPQENGDAPPEDKPKPQRRRRQWDEPQEAVPSQGTPLQGAYILHCSGDSHETVDFVKNTHASAFSVPVGVHCPGKSPGLVDFVNDLNEVQSPEKRATTQVLHGRGRPMRGPPHQLRPRWCLLGAGCSREQRSGGSERKRSGA